MAAKDISVSKAEAPRLARIAELLERLDSYSDLRAACLLGLTDEHTAPPPADALGRRSDSVGRSDHTATLRARGAEAGQTRIDRELRDDVWPRLRELSPAGRELVALGLRMLEVFDLELAPLDRRLHAFARRQPAATR